MSARASRLVTMPLPNGSLLKDYLLDDMSSCSSNGFRSYPRRQCCTKVRYLIEIDLNKHIKLPPTQNPLLRNKSKSKPKLKLKLKPSPVLLRASSAVVNVFKSLRFSSARSSSSNHQKPSFLSKHGFWRRTTDQNNEFNKLNSLFDVPIKQKDNTIPPAERISDGGDEKVRSNTNTSSAISGGKTPDSCFTSRRNRSNMSSYMETVVLSDDSSATSDSTKKEMKTSGSESHTSNSYSSNSSSKIYVTKKNGTDAVTTVMATGNEKKKLQADEKDQFSPISVIDFACQNDNEEEEEEVTSPFQHIQFYTKGCKRKLMSKVQRAKSLTQLKPVRLEDRITISESRTHESVLIPPLQIQKEVAAKKKAIALLQILKATMSSHVLLESTESILLGFFIEQIIEGKVSNYIILQEAKDWVTGQTKEMFESQNNKLTHIKEMEKGVKWLKYDEEETRELVLELEYEVFTSLVEEMLLEFYL